MYVDGKCGDVTCSAVTTNAPYTSTPLPTTTAGRPTWGNRYIDPGNSSSKDMLRYIYIYIYTHTCVVCGNPYFLDDSTNMYCACASTLVDFHNKKAPLHRKRALLCTLTRWAKIKSAHVKEPSITALDPYFTAKEPCIPATKPYIFS